MSENVPNLGIEVCFDISPLPNRLRIAPRAFLQSPENENLVQSQDAEATDQSQEADESSQMEEEASAEETDEEKQRRENEESERLCRQLMAEEVPPLLYAR